MATLLRQLRFRNRISRVFLFGCALALATVVPPQEVLAQAQTFTTTICKQTNPSPDPWGTSFKFTGANGWTTPVNKTFTYLYPPNPFLLKDGQCNTINITPNDKFNKFTEKPVPPGWALTDIKCSYTKSVVSIIGVNPNPAFQPGDNTVTIDQADPNVKCTFVNTLACFRPTGLSLPPCTRPGAEVSLDLSTTQSAGPDPNWTVTPGGPNPTNTSLVAWTALPSNWVQPTKSSTADPAAPPGQYTYTRVFNLPCSPDSYMKGTLQLSGNFAADDSGTVRLNGLPLAGLATCAANCFSAPAGGTAFSQTGPALFVQGLNQLTVTVQNFNLFTGLSVKAQLTAICGPDCVCGCPPDTVLQDGQCVRPKFPIGKKGHQPRKGHGPR